MGNRTLLVDPDGGNWTSVYDALNRRATIQRPNGRCYTAAYDADNRRITFLSGLGTSRAYVFDGVNRLVTQVDFNPSGTQISAFVDGYDAAGNRISRLQNGLLTNWAYDANNRLTGQSGDMGVATFVYNGVNNALIKWHQNDFPLSMAYDAASRLVSTIYASTITYFTFDQAGNELYETSSTGNTTFLYDGENRLLVLSTSTGVFSNTYQGDGLRRTHQEPAKALITTIWDGSNYLGEI